jgi:hypothetical protein
MDLDTASLGKTDTDVSPAWEDPDMAYLLYKQQYGTRGRSRVLAARNAQQRKERHALNTPLLYECILPLSRGIDLYARYSGILIEKAEFRQRCM